MRSLMQTAIFMAILTLVSKILGFIREMVIAGLFGASFITDAYVLASSIPTMIFGGLFTAIAAAYIPLFSEKYEKEGILQANQFTDQVISILILFSVFSATIGFLFSDQIVAVFTNFQGETASLTSFFIKVTFSYVIFSSISSIYEAYLQYNGTFLPQIIAGYFISIMIVLVAVISYFTNYYYLVFGMLLGYGFRFFGIAVIVRSKKYRFKPAFKIKDTAKQIAGLTVPVFIGSAFLQINMFVDRIIATSLDEGVPSALNYAYLLITLMIGLTATILGTLLYPKLAQANTLGDQKRFRELLSAGISMVVMITVPISAGAIFYCDDIIEIVYERGAFDALASQLTSTAFLFYAIGVSFLSLNQLLTQAFYSMKEMKTPVICSGIGVAVNIVLNLVLVRYMGHGGLALATSIASICSAVLLYNSLRKRYMSLAAKEMVVKLLKVLISTIISISISLFCYNKLVLLGMSNKGGFLIAAITAVIIYPGLLYLFKVRELQLLIGKRNRDD